MATTEALKNTLQSRSQEKALAKINDPAHTVSVYLERMKNQIAKALPKHMTPDRMARIALTTIRTNPKLLECNIESLMAAVMQASQLGLEPGLLGHCYIIPYGREAQFIIGYKGMIDLARRSGDIESISVREVYANDTINLKYGLAENIEHIPWFTREDVKPTESGELRFLYLIAKFKGGGHYLEVMNMKEIEEHRSRSKAANNGPWKTDWLEMARKTIVRKAFKWLPLSVEIQNAVQADETVKKEIAEDMSEVPDTSIIEGTYTEVPEAPAHDQTTGEVTS